MWRLCWVREGCLLRDENCLLRRWMDMDLGMGMKMGLPNGRKRVEMN